MMNLTSLRAIAERLSARHLILLRSRVAFVCMYVCTYVRHTLIIACMGRIRFTWGCGLDIHS